MLMSVIGGKALRYGYAFMIDTTPRWRMRYQRQRKFIIIIIKELRTVKNVEFYITCTNYLAFAKLLLQM